MQAERAQLQREVAGYQALDTVLTTGLLRDANEIALSVSESAVRTMLTASLPMTIPLPQELTAELRTVELTFRGNVARVTLEGTLVHRGTPQVSANLRVTGAIERFTVDSARALHASIRVDDAQVSDAAGVPEPFRPATVLLLQRVIDRAIPVLSNALPELSLPVRLDRALSLPGFGPEGALTVQAAQAALSVRATRVLAYKGRLTVVLHVERGPLLTVMP
jgi:hypothetical protein